MLEFLISGALQAGGQYMQGEEQANQMLREADIMDQNAAIAAAAGRYNMMRQQNEAYKVIGAVKSDYAASGISLDSGSVLDVIRESHINAELDRQNIKYGADLRVLEARTRGEALRVGADNAKRAGFREGLLTMVGAGAMASGMGKGNLKPGTGGSTSGMSGTSDYGSAGGSYTNTGSFA